jgi:hypothetical protein
MTFCAEKPMPVQRPPVLAWMVPALSKGEPFGPESGSKITNAPALGFAAFCATELPGSPAGMMLSFKA